MKKKRLNAGKLVLLALFAAACIFVYLYAPSFSRYYYVWKYTKTIPNLPTVRNFTRDDRLLVFSPHPDDEVLCCAGAILKANAAGAQVYVVWMTSGDGFEWDDVLMTRKIK